MGESPTVETTGASVSSQKEAYRINRDQLLGRPLCFSIWVLQMFRMWPIVSHTELSRCPGMWLLVYCEALTLVPSSLLLTRAVNSKAAYISLISASLGHEVRGYCSATPYPLVGNGKWRELPSPHQVELPDPCLGSGSQLPLWMPPWIYCPSL